MALYDPMKPDLIEGRSRARALMYKYNVSVPSADQTERQTILAELFDVPIEDMKDVYIEPP